MSILSINSIKYFLFAPRLHQERWFDAIIISIAGNISQRMINLANSDGN